jgi:hypothetical protein
MDTVLSEIKKWNTKYFSKLENHTKALAVNLLDNRLKGTQSQLYQTDLSKIIPKRTKMKYMSYATGRN